MPHFPVVKRFVLPLTIGAVAGIVGGLFGVGGGVIVVPGLVLIAKMGQHEASGTSVAAIVASSGAALVVLAGDGQVDWTAALLLFAGAGTGAFLATRYLHHVPEHLLAGAFTVVLFVSAVRMWL